MINVKVLDTLVPVTVNETYTIKRNIIKIYNEIAENDECIFRTIRPALTPE